MKKMFLMLALLLALGGTSFADIQVDRGQGLSTADKVFTVVRNGRTTANFVNLGNNGNVISSGSVVVWDTNSHDGVSIEVTGTSFDGRVAGIMIDTIPGSSRDTSASTDENYNNWGRMQVWGFYDEARWAAHMNPNGAALVSGSRVATSAVPGQLGIFRLSADGIAAADQTFNTSRDSAGILLENSTAADTAVDVFVKCM